MFSDSISDPQGHRCQQIRTSRMRQSFLYIPSGNAGPERASKIAWLSPDFKTHHDPVQRFESQRSIEGLCCVVAQVCLQFEGAYSISPAEVANCLDHSRSQTLAAMRPRD